MPVYSLQAQQLVLGHALDDVQVEVLQAHQIVVVVIVRSAERTCGDSLLIDPTHHHCLVSSLHTQQMPKEASANDHQAMHLSCTAEGNSWLMSLRSTIGVAWKCNVLMHTRAVLLS
jgi:hypothetical protein